MKTNSYGEVTVTELEAFQALYTGKVKDFTGVYVDDQSTIQNYNTARLINADRISELKELIHDKFDNIELFDKANQSDWFIPKDSLQENLVEMLYGMCTTEEQTNRVSQELELFIQHGMFDLLFYLKYLVDTLRENKVLWGVGRGSSVASYVLYLIGVHKIDSLKYNLDIAEFLK